MLKLGIVVVVLGLVGVAVATVVPGVLRPSGPSPAVRSTAVAPASRPAPEPEAAPTPSAPLEVRVSSFAQNLREGRPASLDVGESEATNVARTALAQRGEERVRDLRLRFVAGKVEAQATVATPVGNLPVVAVLQPQVRSDGTVDLRVESVKIAGAAPPGVESMARSFVEEQVARRLSQPEWLAIQRLEVTNGQLKLDALPR